MKGATGTSMGGSVIKIKRKKSRADCPKCREYLQTNPLCRLDRKTPRKICKWYVPGPSKKVKQVATGKTMLEVCENIRRSISRSIITEIKKPITVPSYAEINKLSDDAFRLRQEELKRQRANEKPVKVKKNKG